MNVSLEDMHRANRVLSQYVGMKLDDVIGEIRSRFPNFIIDVLPKNALVTADFRYDRIRIVYSQDKYRNRDKFIATAGVG